MDTGDKEAFLIDVTARFIPSLRLSSAVVGIITVTVGGDSIVFIKRLAAASIDNFKAKNQTHQAT